MPLADHPFRPDEHAAWLARKLAWDAEWAAKHPTPTTRGITMSDAPVSKHPSDDFLRHLKSVGYSDANLYRFADVRLLIIRAFDVAAALSQPAVETREHPTHRWNLEPQDDGSLLICRGLHEKGDKCDWERFAAATPPAPDAALADSRTEAIAALERAHAVVSELCDGKREWIMSIPARPDHDPDLIIGNAIRLARRALLAASPDAEREPDYDALERALFEMANDSRSREARLASMHHLLTQAFRANRASALVPSTLTETQEFFDRVNARRKTHRLAEAAVENPSLEESR